MRRWQRRPTTGCERDGVMAKESNKNILFMYTLYTDFVDRILLHSVTHQFGDMTRKV